MQGMALGHHLETLHDGLTTFCDGTAVPVPLVATRIDVRITAGLAVVRTQRSFRNAEDAPIEAVMTFPVGFDAVVTGLAATIDGRRMIGIAQEKAEARETYEAALDEGRLSVLHEEALRGIHVLSVGALPPGAQVEVELEQALALTETGGVPFLRLPMTAGQVYGTSPLLPSDDLTTAAGVQHQAVLTVALDQGRAVLWQGRSLAPGEEIPILLDRAVELRIEGGTFGMLQGHAADGRAVRLSLEAAGAGEAGLDLHVIVDRSGSTGGRVCDSDLSVWEAMQAGLVQELAALRGADRVTLWQFDTLCDCLGSATGPGAATLARKLEGPRGGTELAGAIRSAQRQGARDILVLTDGQTWAHMVEALKAEGPRISAILAGPGSLDANIGHLCALTGGQVLYAPGRDVGSSLRSAFAALRHPGGAVTGHVGNDRPDGLSCRRGGIGIWADWTDSASDAECASDAVGRYAAALALPLLAADSAQHWARAHSLCTHSTSLVLVDESGQATEGLARMRKVPLMQPAFAIQSRLDLAVPVMTSPPRTRVNMDRPSFAEAAPAPTRLRFGIGLAPPAHPSDPFAGFAWDRFGDALLAGDVGSLTAEQMEAVLGWVRRLAAEGQSRAVPLNSLPDLQPLALGLIARQSGGRLAERFARKALKDAPPWVTALV